MKYGYFESINPAYNPIKQLHPNSKYRPSPRTVISGLLSFIEPNQNPASLSVISQKYFVLDHGKLWCKQSQADESFSWVFNLCYVRMEVQSSNSVPQDKELPVFAEKPREDHFILTYGGNSWRFEASSSELTSQWIEHLTRFTIRTDVCSRYKFIGKLRQTELYTVFRALHPMNKALVVVYAYDKEALNNKIKDKLTLLNEITVSRTLDHPNILVAKEVHETDNFIYMIYDSADGSLLDNVNKLTRISNIDIINIMIGILRGIEYLEKQGIYHCEYSSSSVFLRKSTHVQPEDVRIGRLAIHSSMADLCGKSECFEDFEASRNILPAPQVTDGILQAGSIFLGLLSGVRSAGKEEDKACGLLRLSFHEGLARKASLQREAPRHSQQLANIAQRMASFDAGSRPTIKHLIISLVLQKKSLLTVKSLSRRARRDDSVGTAEFEDSDSEKRKSRLTIPTSPDRKKPMSPLKRAEPMSFNHFKALLSKKLKQINEPSAAAPKDSALREGTSCRSFKDVTRIASRASQDGSTANRSSLKIFKKTELGKSNQSMLTMASCSQIKAAPGGGPLAQKVFSPTKQTIPASLSFLKIRRKKTASLNC